MHRRAETSCEAVTAGRALKSHRSNLHDSSFSFNKLHKTKVVAEVYLVSLP